MTIGARRKMFTSWPAGSFWKKIIDEIIPENNPDSLI
jgi:hypothetical protein